MSPPVSPDPAGPPDEPDAPDEALDEDPEEDPEEDPDEDDEWGGCGWLSGIALQGLVARCSGVGALGRLRGAACSRRRKITQSESSLGRRSTRHGEERNSRTGVVAQVGEVRGTPGRLVEQG
ncbi:hypothetical protein ACIQAC_13700 [Streptomyces sp. NPDC088387]|uniref:hypothetical protein n=1 Tax=Streptomyces sp. NPDC088387 TaxID=3365859 RepID=UPI00382D4ACE